MWEAQHWARLCGGVQEASALCRGILAPVLLKYASEMLASFQVRASRAQVEVTISFMTQP